MLNKKSYLELLGDALFLEWRLNPSSELDAYWLRQQEENPGLSDEIQKADYFLKHNYFKKDKLTDSERKTLAQKIFAGGGLSFGKKKRRLLSVQFIRYAAIVVVVLGVTLFFTLLKHPDEGVKEAESNQIVGKIGEETDIQLYVNNELLSYNQNVDIEIDESGSISVDKNIINKKQSGSAVSQLHKVIVPYGKRSKIKLSDNTVVWLNSGTVIEFPALFDKTNREITLLSGECFLEVSEDSDRPFSVITSQIKIKVHGTSFNVSSYENEQPQVTLLSGSVSLTAEQAEQFFLSPSEQAVLEGGGYFTKQVVDVSEYISWRNGHLILDKTPLTDVLKKIERYYNLTFDNKNFENFKDIRCKGKLILSENLENVLRSISILSSTSYTIDNNIIYISNKTQVTDDI